MHVRKPDGSLEPFERESPAKREYFPGGGSLYSTGGDYLTFLRMLLNGGSLNGTTFLRPETLEAMAQNHIGDIDVGGMKPARLELSNNVEFFPGMTKKWGLRFLINTQDAPTGRSAGSLAWARARQYLFLARPEQAGRRRFLTQVLPFGDPTVLRLLDDFETAIYA